MSLEAVLSLRYVFLAPLGRMVVEIRENRISRLDFTDAPLGGDKTTLSLRVADEVNQYFKGERRSFNLPLFIEATAFQQAVYAACQAIPYGEVYYYSDIAEKIQKPKAVRAVGGALNKNKHIILIPCHRVIAKATGGGYRHGEEKKQELLQLEKGGCW